MMIARMICAAAFVLVAAAPIAAQRKTASGDAKKGFAAYRANGCSACHGTVGQGGAWQGPKLAPGPVPYEAFIAQLREPARMMPRYVDSVLSDADAKAIYAYLQSIPPGKSAAQIEILNR